MRPCGRFHQCVSGKLSFLFKLIFDEASKNLSISLPGAHSTLIVPLHFANSRGRFKQL